MSNKNELSIDQILLEEFKAMPTDFDDFCTTISQKELQKKFPQFTAEQITKAIESLYSQWRLIDTDAMREQDPKVDDSLVVYVIRDSEWEHNERIRKDIEKGIWTDGN